MIKHMASSCEQIGLGQGRWTANAGKDAGRSVVPETRLRATIAVSPLETDGGIGNVQSGHIYDLPSFYKKDEDQCKIPDRNMRSGFCCVSRRPNTHLRNLLTRTEGVRKPVNLAIDRS
jgi:hypothetical protein